MRIGDVNHREATGTGPEVLKVALLENIADSGRMHTALATTTGGLKHRIMSVLMTDGDVAATFVDENGSHAPPWEPLSLADYLIITVVAACQAVALAMCAHLLWCRNWPPYITKSVNLVVITTLSGVLWGGTLFVHYGFFRRKEGDLFALCDFELFLTWSTLSAHVMTFFIRIYRLWKILIKHDDKMWRAEYQILLLSSVSLIPVATAWIIPETAKFDEVANSCGTTIISDIITLALDAWGFFGIFFLWFVCARQLKSVRRQFNEYESSKRTLLYITLSLASFVIIVVFVLSENFALRRRVAVFYPVMTVHILLWGPIITPFIKKMAGDHDYLLGYTKGFEQLPSPAQLKASLAEQLSVDQLRIEFRRYIRTKVAHELVDFYLDSLDREEVDNYFDRQAVTMRIVERYIREGAPDQVNISGECRDKILETDVTSYEIFDEARAEVLNVMETNFQRDFAETEGFRRIADATEQEQRELRILRERGMLPPPPPASVSSPSNDTSLPLFWRLVAAVRNLTKVSLAGRVSISTTSAMHVRTSPTDWSSGSDMAVVSFSPEPAPFDMGSCSGGDDDGSGKELHLNGESPHSRSTDEDIMVVMTPGEANTANGGDACARNIHNSRSMRGLRRSDNILESLSTVYNIWGSEESVISARPGSSPWPQRAGGGVELDANNGDNNSGTDLEDDGCSLPSSIEISSSRTLSEDSLV